MSPPRFEETRVPPPQHSEAQLKVLECRPHRVKIERSRWPPREKRGNEDQPHVDVPCLKCGALVQAVSPVPKNLQVVLTGDAEEAHGQVIEETEGQVIEESALPPEPVGGTVTLEERVGPRGRKGA